ncbi:MAG: pyridoxal phosphate-dependent aminotransferase, partial [Blastochloris sp.]|nr:pyridoxal phosphate-dependent aminotransferase [Blastochloris sp.]
TRGLFELREAVAAHLHRLYGLHYNPENEILITVGVSEGLQSLALGVLNGGDEVIMTDPYYVAYPGCVMMADARPVFVPTSVENGFQVSATAIEAAITPRTRAIMLGYPSNPTGAVMSRAGMAEIAAVAERHNLMIFSDEIYDRLVYDTEHVCAATLPGARDRTALFGGFSKAYAMTGWRLGWIAAPADMTGAAAKVHQYSIMSAATMSQHAGLAALKEGEPYVREMVAEYDRRRRLLVKGLNALGLPTIEPQGAFYAFPQVGHFGLNSKDFAKQLLLEGQVAIIPGSAFGACGEGYARVCYATSMDTISCALERIEKFLRAKGWMESNNLSVQSGAAHNVWNAGRFAAGPNS